MMFYTQLFSSKRDSLAKIWLAAHWDKKVTKAHVFDCNLESTVRDILSAKMRIGLRTSGHLLMGVVRIYSRKTKYLLVDCSDALVRIKVSFRPGQTDLPVVGLEAAIQSITLVEDFTAFDAQLPHPNAMSVEDNFSLNQSRTEDITLKEDFGRDFRNLMDFGDEPPCQRQGLLDLRLSHHRDSFGDEDKGHEFLDFMANLNGCTEESMDFITAVLQNETPETALLNIHPIDDSSSVPTEPENKVPSEATPLAYEEEGFALEPVVVMPSTERRRGKSRRRRLLVDQTKGLSNKDITGQLADDSALWSPPDMAPPTAQLMQWKESGNACALFGRLSSAAVSSQLQQLFSQSIFGLGNDGAAEERDPELMRKDKLEVQDTSIFSTDTTGLIEEPVNPEITMESMEMEIEEDSLDKTNGSSERPREDSIWEVSHQQLPSEADSMLVHPTGLANECDLDPHTQSMLDSQDEDEEEKRMTKRVLKLLHNLKAQSTDTFSLQAICEGGARSRVAAVFFCLLVLQKEQAVELQQATPYGDIAATPGSTFNRL